MLEQLHHLILGTADLQLRNDKTDTQRARIIRHC